MAAKDRFETLGAGFDVAKQLIIVGCIVALVIKPALFIDFLHRAGVEEFEGFGAKIKPALAHTAADIVKLRDANRTLTERLAATEAQLADAIAAVPSGVSAPLLAAADATRQENAAAVETSAAVSQRAEQTLDIWAPTIASAEGSVPRVLPRFLVVFGGDTTAASGRDELRRAARAGFAPTRLYLRGGSFRSAVEFTTREAAAAALPGIRALSPTAREAAVREFTVFCPNPVPIASDLTECK